MSEKTTLPADSEVTTADAQAPAVRDKELELYRTLLEPAKSFSNGFTWTTVAGALFCGLLMMPGTIYLMLMTGGLIPASWVTLIIFSEVSRRALKSLSTQELVVLLYVAGAMSLGGPFYDLIWRQYLTTSDAARDAGLLGQFPSWYAPLHTSVAMAERMLWHKEWLIPILLVVFMAVFGRISSYTLGYFLFRLTSDVERLPFPMAPVGAQGAMALAESGEKQTTWKWRVFSIGAVLGLVFSALYIGVPLVTGAFLAKPIQLIPLPWYDTTTMTETIMPATPTGIVMDLGLVLTGMVVPFWAMIGSGIAMVLTFVLNPILHNMGILTRWQPGMDTINTSYQNNIDFWMSFTIGVTAAIATISIFQTLRDLFRRLGEARKQRAEAVGAMVRTRSMWETPAGRGDFSPWIAIGIYFLCSTIIVWVCHILVPELPIYFLLFFTVLYTPLISYINAKLIGICGQQVNIPFVREGAFILSGVKGVNLWLAPIPIDNHGARAQDFRINELTGTSFWSYVKADCLIVPLSLALSFIFWAFVWHASAIPSESFPFAQKMWDLQAKNTVLMWTATLDTGSKASSLFYQALHPNVIGGSFLFTIIGFTLLSAFSLPTMAIYGFLQGIGIGMPHSIVPMLVGSLVGKFYFHKRFGQKTFLQMAPVLVAGYSVGAGLVALIGVAIQLIKNAISPAPF